MSNQLPTRSRRTDLNSQVKRKRTVRTKGQLPIRESERLKEQASQKPKPPGRAPGEDTYLHIGCYPESGDEDEEFGSSKSNFDSETEESKKNIKDRVEINLNGKQEVKPTDANQSSDPQHPLADIKIPLWRFVMAETNCCYAS